MSSSSGPDQDIYVTKTRSSFSSWLHGKPPAKGPKSATVRVADIVREGTLLKQGMRLKLWSKRYFILRLESHHMTLGYYTSKEDLTLCSETPIGPGHRLLDLKSTKHPFRFELRSGAKSLILEAESERDYEGWKMALEEACRWNDTMVPTANGSLMTYGNKVSQDQEQQHRRKSQEAAAKAAKANVTKSSKEQANQPKYLPCTREGNQCFTVSNAKFDIPNKYEFVKVIGSGAYGVVIAVSDTETGKQVAIKNIQRAFDDLTDAKRIVREIKLMKHMQHKYLLGLIDILPPISKNEFEDVYIVSEAMATDLHRVIYSRHALSNEHVAFFMYQSLHALRYMHSANVLHRDLKPSNILLNGNCELKICDFGLARGLQTDKESIELTEYVVTRWYRAPEIMLGVVNYTKEVDVWALGCIFAEMIARKPLFPGQDYIDQLHMIMNTVGAPNEKDLDFVQNKRARKFMISEFHKRGAEPSKPLESIFPDINPDALDLLKRMLVINPAKRISIEDALNHPYLKAVTADMADEEDILFDDPRTIERDFNFEAVKLEKPDLQNLIWNEMLLFHPERRSPEDTPSTTSTEATSSASSTVPSIAVPVNTAETSTMVTISTTLSSDTLDDDNQADHDLPSTGGSNNSKVEKSLPQEPQLEEASTEEHNKVPQQSQKSTGFNRMVQQ